MTGLGGKSFTELLTGVPGGVLGFPIVQQHRRLLPGHVPRIHRNLLHRPASSCRLPALGIDLVWFGVIMAINLQIAFISPPVGFSLFYLQSVAPKEVPTSEIHRSAFPFMALSGHAHPGRGFPADCALVDRYSSG